MNIYTQTFSVTCPKNKERVEYRLQIETFDTIMVEDLQDYVREIGSDYHEAIADELHDKFGGTQTLDAHHHGTDIRTLRP